LQPSSRFIGFAPATAAAGKETAMDAIRLLKQEHEKAKQMFAQIQGASGEQRGQLWTTLAPELKVHEQMEETALYGPIASEVKSKDEQLETWNETHREEVSEAESMIEEINGLAPTDAPWLEKVKELHEMLEHHIQEEEGEIWPRIRNVWDAARLEQAGVQMETIKRQKLQQAA